MPQVHRRWPHDGAGADGGRVVRHDEDDVPFFVGISAEPNMRRQRTAEQERKLTGIEHVRWDLMSTTWYRGDGRTAGRTNNKTDQKWCVQACRRAPGGTHAGGRGVDAQWQTPPSWGRCCCWREGCPPPLHVQMSLLVQSCRSMGRCASPGLTTMRLRSGPEAITVPRAMQEHTDAHRRNCQAIVSSLWPPRAAHGGVGHGWL